MSGKWSDPSSVLGSHDMYGRRDMLAREMSGDVGWPPSLLGRRVGWSLFRTPWLLEFISSANVVPLASWRAEHQSESCALKSPNMIELSELRRGEMEGLKVLGQLLSGGMYMFVIVMPSIFMEMFSMNGSSETSGSLSKRSDSCTRNSTPPPLPLVLSFLTGVYCGMEGRVWFGRSLVSWMAANFTSFLRSQSDSSSIFPLMPLMLNWRILRLKFLGSWLG